VLQAHKDPQAHKVLLVPQDHKEQLDYKDHKDPQAHKVLLVPQALRVQQEVKELLVVQDPLVHKAAKEVLDQLDQPEQLGPQAQLAHRV
jgi:hypothetical protein